MRTSALISTLAAFSIVGAKALNSCLDPASADFACEIGSGSRTDAEVSFSGCGLVNEDLPDVAACLDSLGREDITLVSLRENSLTQLPVGLFAGLPNLLWLVLGLNDLEFLEPGIFDGLPNLIRLGLRQNAFTELPSGVFSGLSSLLVLVVANSYIADLPAGLFDDQTNLDVLDVRGNQLSTLPEGIFSNLPATADLYLFDNPDLQCLPATDANPIIVQDPGSVTSDFEDNVLSGTCECPEDACTGGDVCTPGNEGYVCGEPAVNACLDSTNSDYRCLGNTNGRGINLNGCGLADADVTMLHGCFEDMPGPIRRIENINMGNNDFTTLPGDLLDGMTRLKTLNLNAVCGLTCIPSMDTGGSNVPEVLVTSCSADAIHNTCS